MRRLLTALAVCVAVAAWAAPAFAKGPIPKGLSGQVVLTSTGAVCSGTLTIGWNSKYSQTTEIDYAADSSLGGTPTPSVGLVSTPFGANKVKTQVPFTLPSGQSTAFQITAKNGGTTITTATSNTASCP